MFNLKLNWRKVAEMDDGFPGSIGAGPKLEVVPQDEGSLYKVPYTTILEINPHEKADRLEFATVYGFQVIVPKGRYKVGDKAIYIPIDSILPDKLEELIFPPDAKIKLHHHRVRQIRIRGMASQGMLIQPSEIASIVNPDYLTLEMDLKTILGITKYEPPQTGPSRTNAGQPRNKKTDHPLFHKYNGLNNIKWFPNMFKEGDLVHIQEKLHGTNARASVLPFRANTLKKKLMKFFRLAPAVENCYGSNNVEISSKRSYNGYYGEDVYGSTFEKLKVFDKLALGETVYGEIIGPNIQKNYDYGLNEPKFVLFDVKRLNPDGTQTWLSPKEVMAFAIERGFETVPLVYAGPFNKEMTYTLTKGPSLYDPKQKVREGIVIKATENYSIEGNKQALKWVSEDYLDDKSNTDFH